MTHKLHYDGFIGEGTLYIRRFDKKQGLLPMGNAKELSVSMESEVKERVSRMIENYGATLNTVIIPKSGELKIILDDFNEENLAMVFMGALEKASMRAQTVSDEAIKHTKGWITLKHRYLKGDTVTVKKAAGSAPVDKEFYEVHERLGLILFKDNAGLNADEALLVSYETHDFHSWVINANTESQVQCELLLDGRNRVNGKDVRLHIPRATLSANGAFDFFSEDFNTLELTGRPEVVEGNIAPFTVEIKV